MTVLSKLVVSKWLDSLFLDSSLFKIGYLPELKSWTKATLPALMYAMTQQRKLEEESRLVEANHAIMILLHWFRRLWWTRVKPQLVWKSSTSAASYEATMAAL